MGDKLILELENIGGLKGIHKFEFIKGINVIKAPNAIGKTSLLRGLELLVLTDKELKNKGYYMNLMTSLRDYARVKIENDFTLERRFRRIGGGESLTCVEGNPLYRNSVRVSTICFAVPENELINKILAKEPIKEYIEKFSDVEYYKEAVEIINEIKKDLDRQHQLYRSDLIRLEQEEEILKEEESELKKLQEELASLPKIDLEKITKDEELREQLDRLEREKSVIEKEIHDKRRKIEELVSEIQFLDSEIEILERRIKDIGKDEQKIMEEIHEADRKKREIEDEIEDITVDVDKIDDELKMVNKNFQLAQKYKEGERAKCHACGRPLTLRELREWEEELKRAKRELEDKKRELERAREYYEDEIDKLERDRQELRATEKELKGKINTRMSKEKTLNELKKEVTELEKKRDIVEENIEKLYRSIDINLMELKRKRETIEYQIKTIKTRMDARKSRIEDLRIKAKEAAKIAMEIEFTERFIRHLTRRKEEILNAVAKTFETRALDIYNRLGFKDFEEIKIVPPDFRIYIKRSGYDKNWPLEALSTSERITLAVILLIAAKEEYLPDFPFFVMDELVTSYDPEKFWILTYYIAQFTDYVLVTQLAERKEVGEIVKVEYIPRKEVALV